MCVSALVEQLILYETWQFWGESNKSKHWFWFRHNRGRHCVGDWCKERIFLPAIQLHVWKCLLWEMIFYFSLLHGVHCTPVACYYTTDISTHHSLEASGKNAKSPSLLKGSTKYTKFLMYHPSVLGNQNDIQGCHLEGSFHQLALRKIKTMKT